MFKVGLYERHLKAAWCCARNGFPQHCCLSGTRSCSCSSPSTLNLLHHLMPVTLADGDHTLQPCVVLLCSPWHHRTGWMRIACCSGGDLRVTRAASPRSAWVKRTEQVRGEGGLHACWTCVILLISLGFGQVVGQDRDHGCRGSPAADHIRGHPIQFVCNKRRLCCKRASFTIPDMYSLLCCRPSMWNCSHNNNVIHNDMVNQ